MTQARNPEKSGKSSSGNRFCCQKSLQAPQKFLMVPSLQRSAIMRSQAGQNKTYVRLSVKRPPEGAAGQTTAGATASVNRGFSCYQTLLDITNPTYRESGKN